MAVTHDPLTGYADLIHEVMEDRGAPGLAVAVVRGDEIVLLEGFGYRDRAAELPVTPETAFPLASVTKSFTGTAAAVLVDEGLLDWDTPVREYVPTFELYDPFATEHVTMRDLLAQVWGVSRNDAMWANRDTSRKELFERLRYLEPFAEIRTIHHYSNLGYMAAGYIIGEVAGSSWEEVVRTRLFEPLGMSSSNFSIREAKHWPNVARAYERRDDEVTLIDYYERQEAIGPCGAITSTAADLANWLRLHVNRGRFTGRQVVSEEQMHQVRIAQAPYREHTRYEEMPGGNSGYGFGWSVDDYRGHSLVNHGGGINGFSTWAAFMPDIEVGVAILCNIGAAAAITRSVGRSVFDRFLGLDEVPWYARYKQDASEGAECGARSDDAEARRQVQGTSPAHELTDYAGTFEHPAYGTLVLTLRDGDIVGRFNDYDFSLSHYHYDHFRLNSTVFSARLVEFHTAWNGDVSAVSIPFDSTSRPLRFERVYEVDAAITAGLPASYELETGESFTIRPSPEGGLVASLPFTDGRLSRFVAEGERSFVPVALDPTYFGIEFTNGAEEAHVRISRGTYLARRVAGPV
jgi:CubicO group peptidase (beta-lactamase class C family)